MIHVRRRDRLRASARRSVLLCLRFLPWWTGLWLVLALPNWVGAVWTGGAGPGVVLAAIGVASFAVVLHRVLEMTQSRVAFGLAAAGIAAGAAGAGAMVRSLAEDAGRSAAMLSVTAVGWLVLVAAGTAAIAFTVLPESAADDE